MKMSKIEDIDILADQLVEQMGIKGKPKVVDLTRKEAVVHTLTEAKINCQADEKVCLQAVF